MASGLRHPCLRGPPAALEVAARRKVDEEGGPELLLEGLVEALEEPGAALVDLDLAQNSSIAPRHFETLFDVLVTSNVRVGKLRLFGCPRFDDEAAAHLAQLLALATPETAPAELHLHDCALTTVGFLALMRAVEEGDVYPVVKAPGETQPLFLRCERNFIDEAVIGEKVAAGVIHTTSWNAGKTQWHRPAVRVHLFTVGGRCAQLTGEPPDPGDAAVRGAAAPAAAAARGGAKRGSDPEGEEERGEDATPEAKRPRRAQPEAAATPSRGRAPWRWAGAPAEPPEAQQPARRAPWRSAGAPAEPPEAQPAPGGEQPAPARGLHGARAALGRAGAPAEAPEAQPARRTPWRSAGAPAEPPEAQPAPAPAGGLHGGAGAALGCFAVPKMRPPPFAAPPKAELEELGKEALVGIIKAFCKEKEQNLRWRTYCRAHGYPQDDPSRKPVEFLRTFLEVPEEEEGEKDVDELDKVVLVGIIKASCQDKEQHLKWRTYCRAHEYQQDDPGMKPVEFLRSFLNSSGAARPPAPAGPAGVSLGRQPLHAPHPPPGRAPPPAPEPPHGPASSRGAARSAAPAPAAQAAPARGPEPEASSAAWRLRAAAARRHIAAVSLVAAAAGAAAAPPPRLAPRPPPGPPPPGLATAAAPAGARAARSPLRRPRQQHSPEHDHDRRGDQNGAAAGSRRRSTDGLGRWSEPTEQAEEPRRDVPARGGGGGGAWRQAGGGEPPKARPAVGERAEAAAARGSARAAAAGQRAPLQPRAKARPPDAQAEAQGTGSPGRRAQPSEPRQSRPPERRPAPRPTSTPTSSPFSAFGPASRPPARSAPRPSRGGAAP